MPVLSVFDGSILLFFTFWWSTILQLLPVIFILVNCARKHEEIVENVNPTQSTEIPLDISPVEQELLNSKKETNPRIRSFPVDDSIRVAKKRIDSERPSPTSNQEKEKLSGVQPSAESLTSEILVPVGKTLTTPAPQSSMTSSKNLKIFGKERPDTKNTVQFGEQRITASKSIPVNPCRT
uniref:DUF4408 domain-containing protein n=1 Tax=Panagrolaimus sp. JU765 TaxID=591449 RepID=A0AC34QLE2_9BILA